MEKIAYTIKEKAILASIIKEKGSVIESKKTDAASLEKKNKVWQDICTYYNAQPEVGCKRTSKQLKKCWANLKQAKRKITTEERYEILKTGGGTISREDNPLMDIIDEAAPHLDVQLECQFDSSARFERDTSDSASASQPPPKKVCQQNKQMDEEKALRIQKLKESIEQQRELHGLRLEAAKAELEAVIKNTAELHELKLETAKAELAAAVKCLEN